jgi:hypothetical protein
MSYLVVVGLLGLLGTALIAMLYYHKAAISQLLAEQERQRAEAAEADVKQRHRLDRALNTLHETHREETIHETAQTHLAKRSDFDNDWSGPGGMRGEGPRATPATSAAAADSTDATGHFIHRPDLR